MDNKIWLTSDTTGFREEQLGAVFTLRKNNLCQVAITWGWCCPTSKQDEVVINPPRDLRETILCLRKFWPIVEVGSDEC